MLYAGHQRRKFQFVRSLPEGCGTENVNGLSPKFKLRVRIGSCQVDVGFGLLCTSVELLLAQEVALIIRFSGILTFICHFTKYSYHTPRSSSGASHET